MVDPTIDSQPPPRSAFVTVVALCFAGYAGLGALGAGGQLVIVPVMMARTGFDEGVFSAWLLLPLSLLVFFSFELWTCIALLRRRPWAWRVFIGFRILNLTTMVLGVVGIVVAAIAWRVSGGELLIQAFIVAMWIPLAVLFVWIIRKLRSAAVKAEFDLA